MYLFWWIHLESKTFFTNIWEKGGGEGDLEEVVQMILPKISIFEEAKL